MVPGASSPRHSMGGLRRGAAWPRSSYRLPFDGSDQQLYGMDDRDVQAARTSALSDLHETAGIPRRHDRGPRLRDPRDLELQELARDPGLEDAVHPRASAAEVARELLRSEEHTSELQSLAYLVCRLLLEKKKNISSPPVRLKATSAAVHRYHLSVRVHIRRCNAQYWPSHVPSTLTESTNTRSQSQAVSQS